MVCQMQGIALAAEQFNRLANAAWLVNAALFTERQMHGQVQERIDTTAIGRCVHGPQGGIQIGKISGVFGVQVQPSGCYRFNRLQHAALAGLGVNLAKEAAHIGSRWGEHGQRLT